MYYEENIAECDKRTMNKIQEFLLDGWSHVEPIARRYGHRVLDTRPYMGLMTPFISGTCRACGGEFDVYMENYRTTEAPRFLVHYIEGSTGEKLYNVLYGPVESFGSIPAIDGLVCNKLKVML